MNRNIRIGTSGWMYNHWNRTFYAEAGKDQLVYYAKEFNTVELNYSFYRMPDPKSYIDWHARTPADFTFTVKMNRYITHIKRLIMDNKAKAMLHSFLTDTQGLKDKLAIILIQLQPSQSIDIKRLNDFFLHYNTEIAKLDYKPKTCIEFRNTSWFSEDTFKVLAQHYTSLVFPSTPEYRHLVYTSDFTFIRIHGNKLYSDMELNALREEILNYPPEIKEVYVYFNNDIDTNAIYNARYLKSIL